MSIRVHIAAVAVVAVLGTVAAGCSSPAQPDPDVAPIQIERVEVRVLESAPPQAVAHVEGIIGDGCSALESQTQSRSGSTVTLTVLARRPRAAICTQIARLYREDVPLQGTYPAGQYVLVVNGHETPFTTH